MSVGRVVACADCQRPRPNAGRGLCKNCYARHRYHDTLTEFARTNVPAADVLDDWQMLRDDGYTYREAAPRLRMSEVALRQAVARAKRRGDPRGSRVPFARDMAGVAA